MFRQTAKFTSVKSSQPGGEFALESDPWEVELWSVNSKAGNRNLTMIREYEPDLVLPLTRKAIGRATKSDNKAFARREVQRELDRE